MSKIYKSWKLTQWKEYADKVKIRDNYQCLNCNRSENEVTLQVHHTIYRNDKLPWEYALSDCQTLCKGCHAREHGLIEPSSGWHLIAIDDLGDLTGHCERHNCNANIRYEHSTYHPNWGYKIVGSTCIEYLTQKDQLLSTDIVKTYKKISNFITNSNWEIGRTQKNKRYIQSKYKYHLIRLYGENETKNLIKENKEIDNFSFQIAIKVQGIKWHEYEKPVYLQNKSLEEVKELAFITLLGTISKDNEEVTLLRNIYRNTNN